MAKATIQDIVNLGFNAKQFGNPADFEQAGGFIDAILVNIGLVVSDAVGATLYASASNLDLYRIEEAEKYLVSAEMLRRLANFNQSKMNNSQSENSSTERENEKILLRAAMATKTAEMHLRALGVETEAALAVGYNEHNHFQAAV